MENWDVWADLDGSSNLQTRYVRGNEVDELFSRVKSDGTVAWYLADRMGSVRQMTDAAGAVQDTLVYDGFGKIVSESTPNFGDRFKWTGREYDSDSGLQYNRARYYSGNTGQWVNEDPIRFLGLDHNLSRYSLNMPMQYRDPSGYSATSDLDKNLGRLLLGPPRRLPNVQDILGRPGEPKKLTDEEEIMRNRIEGGKHQQHIPVPWPWPVPMPPLYPPSVPLYPPGGYDRPKPRWPGNFPPLPFPGVPPLPIPIGPLPKREGPLGDIFPT